MDKVPISQGILKEFDVVSSSLLFFYSFVLSKNKHLLSLSVYQNNLGAIVTEGDGQCQHCLQQSRMG